MFIGFSERRNVAPLVKAEILLAKRSRRDEYFVPRSSETANYFPPRKDELLMLSISRLNVRTDSVTCLPISEASDELRQLNLNGRGKLLWIVPTKLASHVVIISLFSEQIKGGTIYVS